MNIFKFLWNTPERYWLIVFGYHIHKAFWGVLLIVLGLTVVILNYLYFGISLVLIGLLLVLLDIRAHVEIGLKPYFILWNKHPKKIN